jgi:hypothetical protein
VRISLAYAAKTGTAAPNAEIPADVLGKGRFTSFDGLDRFFGGFDYLTRHRFKGYISARPRSLQPDAPTSINVLDETVLAGRP